MSAEEEWPYYVSTIQHAMKTSLHDFQVLSDLMSRLQMPTNLEETETYLDMLSATSKIKEGTITLYQGFLHLVTNRQGDQS